MPIPFKPKDHFKVIPYVGKGSIQKIGNTFGTRPNPTYAIAKSVRVRGLTSAYFSRTPGSVGSRQKWTFSAWVKRSTINTDCGIFAAEADASNRTDIGFNSSGALVIYQLIGGSTVQINLTSTQLIKNTDHFHLHISCDTTTSTVTASINGTALTLTGTFPSVGINTYFGNTSVHYLGSAPTFLTNKLDGYLSEVYFIDGQALPVTSFGQTDSAYDSWVPTQYLGTYGTTGFYLNFSDNSSITSGSNTGIGRDFSGNSNYFNSTNISVTGTTNDSITDTPTNQYPILESRIEPAAVLDGGLTFTSSTTYHLTPCNVFPTSGVWYCEVQADANNLIGFYSLEGLKYTPSGQNIVNSYGWYGTTIYTNNAVTYQSGLPTYTNTDVIGLVFDADNKIGYWYKNNSLVASVNLLSTDTYTFAVGDYHSTLASTATINFGQKPFTYTPPQNSKALCSQNIDYDTHAPWYDLYAIKDRTTANNWAWLDTVRGLTAVISSDSTASEVTLTSTQITTSKGGLVLDTADAKLNTIGDKYIAFAFKAGKTATTNSQGSISAQVSANPTAGFSIITYTGTGANATVGHGLGVAPKVVFFKTRTGVTREWLVYHGAMPSTADYLLLSNVAGKQTDATVLNGAPTNLVVNLGTSPNVNGSTILQVAYCFAEIPGFSKFGSYTGNGSTDGPFTYCGFKPSVVIYKRTDASGGWYIMDNVRNPFNVTNISLGLNSTAVDYSGGGNEFDLLSNGFKARTSSADQNASGGTYVYMAFADISSVTDIFNGPALAR